MVRKQIYIEARQEALLKRRSKELHVSEAALIREGIDRALLESHGPPPDRAAWEKELRYLRSIKRSTHPSPRRWTRDELHER